MGRGLDVKVGRFYSLYGVEGNESLGNPLMSHSYTDVYDPFTHTGVLNTLKLNETWTVQAGLVLGSDVFIDRASVLTGIGTVKWAPSSEDATAFSSR